ncbi:MAG: hypothetical protein QOJ19_2969 [Acidimicrobiia bacterium]|jgi:cytochrome bd-type quinol oxidase subunit 2|nr:hypothetical protein [Acidimicrobiia bacterium]
MDKLFGLPAHPLLVHAPVVFAPLVCLAVILTFVLRGGRRRYGYALVASAAVTFLSTILAVSSGGRLETALKNTIGNAARHHSELGRMTRILAGLLFLAVLAWVLVGRALESPNKDASSSGRRIIVPVLGGISIIVSVLLVIWTIRTGHAGAKLVWQTG